MAEKMARQGIRLALCSRTEPALANSENVLARCVDVTDGEAVEEFAAQAADRFGGIDLWINNAGVLEPIAPLRDISSDAFRTHLEINLTGVFHGTRAFVKLLRRTGRPGVLINISSGAGRKPYEGWSAYCAAKAAVDRLTECVALEEADHGLRAYSVAPGIIDTHMQALIRSSTAEQFPQVERFLEYKRNEAFNTPAFVARELLALAFDPSASPTEILTRLPTT